ncbi:MAG TPA: SH3 domain-containing protein [Mariprofundaceae bacterium]|nr:SH3 domain-containing protein [Mariprofundaceae bacterium]
MRTALAASQQALRDMKLDADLLEPQDKDGYVILFGNNKIDGQISLTSQTPELTTFNVKVKNGMSREDSIERAILDVLHKKSGSISSQAKFDFRGYDQIRQKPDTQAQQLAWFRQGASLPVSAAGNKHPGWLKIKLPSSKTGYLTGDISESHTVKK